MLIADSAQLVILAEEFRLQGKRIVFTNGCFDLLHVGHIRCLTAARQLGDCLFVGLNSDASVRANKHSALPVQPAEERAEILLALEVVDHVLIFDSPTADAMLETLQPEIYAKGREYTEATIPEAETVRNYGGKIMTVGDEKTHATQSLISRASDIFKAMNTTHTEAKS